MIDRIINLFVLGSITAMFLVLGNGLRDAWERSEPWDLEWEVKAGRPVPYQADRLLTAIRNAKAVGETADAMTLQGALESDYTATGAVLERLTRQELIAVSISVLPYILAVIVLLSTNYVRHGEIRIWNRKSMSEG